MKKCFENQIELKQTGTVIASSDNKEKISGIVRILWEKSIHCTITHPIGNITEIVIASKDMRKASE